jgi:hypothetical protein
MRDGIDASLRNNEGMEVNHGPTNAARDERLEELKRTAAMPNGINKLYLIVKTKAVPFDRLPIKSLMIDAILAHEYPQPEVNPDGAARSMAAHPQVSNERGVSP